MAKLYKRAESTLYWCRFYLDGKEIRKPTGSADRLEAQRVADELEKAHKTSAKQLSIEDAITRYWEHKNGRLSPYTEEAYQRYFDHVVEWLKTTYPTVRDLKQLQTEHFAEYLRWRRTAERGGVLTRCILTAWGSLFTAARLWPDGVKESPLKTLDTSRVERARSVEIHITPDQLEQLLRYCKEQAYKDMIVVAAFTGLRIREQSELQWRQVNLKRRELTLYMENTKTRTSRTVPLCAPAVQVLTRLSAQPHAPNDVVFKNHRGAHISSKSGWWFRVKKAAGLQHIRWHDLRHHFASWWIQNGGDEYRLQKVLGHATASMTKRYAHLRTEDLHSELEKVGRTGRTAYPGNYDGVDTP